MVRQMVKMLHNLGPAYHPHLLLELSLAFEVTRLRPFGHTSDVLRTLHVCFHFIFVYDFGPFFGHSELLHSICCIFPSTGLFILATQLTFS